MEFFEVLIYFFLVASLFIVLNNSFWHSFKTYLMTIIINRSSLFFTTIIIHNIVHIFFSKLFDKTTSEISTPSSYLFLVPIAVQLTGILLIRFYFPLHKKTFTFNFACINTVCFSCRFDSNIYRVLLEAKFFKVSLEV